MLSSGYEGVREIQKRLTNTMGWSATSGMVDNWVYDEARLSRCNSSTGVCQPLTGFTMLPAIRVREECVLLASFWLS